MVLRVPQYTYTSLQGLLKSLPEYLSPSSYPEPGEAEPGAHALTTAPSPQPGLLQAKGVRTLRNPHWG